MARVTSCVKVLSSLVPVLIHSPFPRLSCYTSCIYSFLTCFASPCLPSSPRVFFAYLDQFLVLDRFCPDLPLLNRTCSTCSVCIWVQLLSYRFWHNGRKQWLNQRRCRMCESLSKWTWNRRQPRNVQEDWNANGKGQDGSIWHPGNSKVWCKHSWLQEDETWLFSWHLF